MLKATERYDGVPDLEGIQSSISEETLALQNSSSSEFEDVNLSKQVDLIATTLGSKPPKMPLREERMSLGVECVFKAKGAGWNGVKKLSKSQRRKENRIKRKKTILQRVNDCSPFQIANVSDLASENDTRTKKSFETNLQALSYEQYLQYLRRCNAKRKEAIEHPYLELERSQHNQNGQKKKRIFTLDIEARQETFDFDDHRTDEAVIYAEMRDNPSLRSLATADQSLISDAATLIAGSGNVTVVGSLMQRIDHGKETPIKINVSCVMHGDGKVALLPASFEQKNSDRDISLNAAKDFCPPAVMLNKNAFSAKSTLEGMVSSGSEMLERNTVKCSAQDTTVATSTCSVQILPQKKSKPKKEAKVLRNSRASNMMDCVGKNGIMVSKEVVISLTKKGPVRCKSHSLDIEKKYFESRDDTRRCSVPTDIRDDAMCESPVIAAETLFAELKDDANCEAPIITATPMSADLKDDANCEVPTITGTHMSAGVKDDKEYEVPSITVETIPTELRDNVMYVSPVVAVETMPTELRDDANCGEPVITVETMATDLKDDANCGAPTVIVTSMSTGVKIDKKYEDPSITVETMPTELRDDAMCESPVIAVETMAAELKDDANSEVLTITGTPISAGVKDGKKFEVPSITGTPMSAGVKDDKQFEESGITFETMAAELMDDANCEAPIITVETMTAELKDDANCEVPTITGTPISAGVKDDKKYIMPNITGTPISAGVKNDKQFEESGITFETMAAELRDNANCEATVITVETMAAELRDDANSEVLTITGTPISAGIKDDKKNIMPNITGPLISEGVKDDKQYEVSGITVETMAAELRDNANCEAPIITVETMAAELRDDANSEVLTITGTPISAGVKDDEKYEVPSITVDTISIKLRDDVNCEAPAITVETMAVELKDDANSEVSTITGTRTSAGIKDDKKYEDPSITVVTIPTELRDDANCEAVETMFVELKDDAKRCEAPNITVETMAADLKDDANSEVLTITGTPMSAGVKDDANCEAPVITIETMAAELKDDANCEVSTITGTPISAGVKDDKKHEVPSITVETIPTELRDDTNCVTPVITVETMTTHSAPVEAEEVLSELKFPHSSIRVSASSDMSTYSSCSGSTDKQLDMRYQSSLVHQNPEYEIPANLSYESCHSSIFSKDQHSAKVLCDDDTNSMDNDSFGLGDLIPQSFSLSSFMSAKSYLSKRSTLSTEDVENCIAYTVSELGRIHSMLDEAEIEATADNMSCTSESTNGRDVLYFARQSKTEIAALQNLIERHIDSERDSGSFDITPSIISSKEIDDMDINQSQSFGTMTSMKSKTSLLESPSMDKLIGEVNDLCTLIEDRIENIVNDTI